MSYISVALLLWYSLRPPRIKMHYKDNSNRATANISTISQPTKQLNIFETEPYLNSGIYYKVLSNIRATTRYYDWYLQYDLSLSIDILYTYIHHAFRLLVKYVFSEEFQRANHLLLYLNARIELYDFVIYALVDSV